MWQHKKAARAATRSEQGRKVLEADPRPALGVDMEVQGWCGVDAGWMGDEEGSWGVDGGMWDVGMASN